MVYSSIENYLKLVKENISEYMKIILDDKFNKGFCNTFSDVYIDSIYYGTYMPDRRVRTKDELKRNLEDEYNKIISLDQNKDKIKIISIIYDIFIHIVYLENSYKKNRLEEEMTIIYELIKRQVNKDGQDIKELLIQQIKKNIKEKQEFFSLYESKEFYLTKKKVLNNIYKLDIKHNIKFRVIYSDSAINKVFKSGIVNEDKLLIEYIMASVQVINDIENGMYSQDYLLDFAESLFEKKQKLSRLLEIISNYATQIRLNVVLNYTTFIKYKEDIYDMIRQGFKVAITLDEKFEYEILELERLSVFSYILVNKKLESFENIIRNKNKFENIIEI